MPQGYPHSVSEDYLAYQIWDTIQAFASSISSSLATKAILTGVGVGDEEATAVAATITWLLKGLLLWNLYICVFTLILLKIIRKSDYTMYHSILVFIITNAVKTHKCVVFPGYL